ncbi:MAG: hypothetical protein ABMA02_08840 [Saprospiraceae bacterium]
MSDLDKFFAERLNEESEFPLRGKNWKNLSRRLDVAGVGAVGTAGVVLKYWKVAVLGFALVTGLLVWEVVLLQEENKKLREQIKQRQMAENVQPVAAKPGDFVPPVHRPVSVPNPPAVGAQPTPLTEPDHASWSNQNKKASQTGPKNNPSSFRPASAEPVVSVPMAEQHGKEALATEKTESAMAGSPASAAPESATGSEKTETAMTTNRPAGLLAQPATEPAAESEKSPEATALVDLLPQTLPILLPNTDTKPQAPAMVPFSITRPYREKTGRFRVGVQGTLASANHAPEGVSSLIGAGFLAEYSPVRNLWASFSADWLSYDVKTTEYLPPQFCHEPQPKTVKPQPGHQHPLLEVAGHQRMQLYNVGLRYVLPLRYWLRPSVQVAYTWARKSPEVYSYVFEEDQHGGPGPQPPKPPIYVAAPLAGQTISGLWRMGLAAEHETHNWVFRAGVDWIENSAASKPLFDAALVQASVLYKF